MTKTKILLKAEQIANLVNEKNAAYGDSFAKSQEVIRTLYPNGIPVEQYSNALAMIRVIDKLFRIATNNDPFGENPWDDIVGYGLLAATNGE